MTEQTVPRVARSIEDLRVGQVVAWDAPDQEAETGVVMKVTFMDAVRRVSITIPPGAQSRQFQSNLPHPVFVILSEPAPPPVTVPREQYERLRWALQGVLDCCLIEYHKPDRKPCEHRTRNLFDKAMSIAQAHVSEAASALVAAVEQGGEK